MTTQQTMGASILLLIAGFVAIANAAIAQGVAQPAYLKENLADFHGTKNTLIKIIHAIEQGTGGRVAEIRFSETNGMPGYDAVVAKGGRIKFIHMQSDSANVVEIDAASGPVWMLKWRGKADVHFVENAKVTLATAIRTAEASRNGAPAAAAGIARSASNPTSDVQAYNVLLDVDGSARRVAVDDSTGEVIADPSALSDF